MCRKWESGIKEKGTCQGPSEVVSRSLMEHSEGTFLLLNKAYCQAGSCPIELWRDCLTRNAGFLLRRMKTKREDRQVNPFSPDES